jgi:hypothetical protein
VADFVVATGGEISNDLEYVEGRGRASMARKMRRARVR